GQGYSPRLFNEGEGHEKLAPLIRLTPHTARVLAQMMQRTISHGTARKSFRGYQKSLALRDAFLGGKTGSLNSKELHGHCDWFVGFAKKGEERLAVSVVIVNRNYWRIKSSAIARQIFEKALKPAAEIALR